MRVPVITYKNSVIANLISIGGTFLTIIGIAIMRGGELTVGFVVAVMGMGIVYLTKIINEKLREYKKNRMLNNPVFADTIRQSSVQAFLFFQKYPDNETLDYLRRANPYAAKKTIQLLNGEISKDMLLYDLNNYDLAKFRAEQQLFEMKY